jgi:hypothetical protein
MAGSGSSLRKDLKWLKLIFCSCSGESRSALATLQVTLDSILEVLQGGLYLQLSQFVPHKAKPFFFYIFDVVWIIL